MKILQRILLSALALLSCTAGLSAQPAEHRSSDHPSFRMEAKALRKELNLSKSQMERIKKEFASLKEPMKAQSQRLREARTTLRTAIQSGATETEIRNAAATIGTIEGDLAMVRATLFSRIKPILTPEQLEKLKQLQERRASR